MHVNYKLQNMNPVFAFSGISSDIQLGVINASRSWESSGELSSYDLIRANRNVEAATKCA